MQTSPPFHTDCTWYQQPCNFPSYRNPCYFYRQDPTTLSSLCGTDGTCTVRLTNNVTNSICTNNTQCSSVTADDAACLFGPSWNSSHCQALGNATDAWSQLLNCTSCGSAKNTVWGGVSLTVCTGSEQMELIETHDTAYRSVVLRVMNPCERVYLQHTATAMRLRRTATSWIAARCRP